MIDVTSLPESEYMFIFRVQVVLIVFLVLRLGRLALYIIRKNNKGIRQIADSKFQLCFPFVFFAARIYFVEKISGMLIVFLLINALIKPTFNDMMSEDNFKDIRNDILICLILYVWLLLILVGVI